MTTAGELIHQLVEREYTSARSVTDDHNNKKKKKGDRSSSLNRNMLPRGQRSHGLRARHLGIGGRGPSISPETTLSPPLFWLRSRHRSGLIDHRRLFKKVLFLLRASGSRGRGVKLGRMPGLIELGGGANAHRWSCALPCPTPSWLIRSGRERVVVCNLKQTATVGYPLKGGGGGQGGLEFSF